MEIKMPETMTDPTKRHDFVLLFDVLDGNPNGDPDYNNYPRVDHITRHGLVSDVAIKRKVRDYVQSQWGKAIFIQSKLSLNSLIVQGFRDVGVQPPQVPVADEDLQEWLEENKVEDFTLDGDVLTYGGESSKPREIERALLAGMEESDTLRPKLRKLAQELGVSVKKGGGITSATRGSAQVRLRTKYYDIGMFGAVLSTGPNAGQVRGPMQLTFARSIDPIFHQDHTITRQARTTSARMATGPTEFGRKPSVYYGLYRAHGFFSPLLGKDIVSSEDLKIFWEALVCMFEFDRAAARGQMATRGLFVFTHESPRGNAHAHRLFERVNATRKQTVEEGSARSFGDYDVTLNQEGFPPGVSLHVVGELDLRGTRTPEGWEQVREGVTLTRLVG